MAATVEKPAAAAVAAIEKQALEAVAVAEMGEVLAVPGCPDPHLSRAESRRCEAVALELGG